MVEFPPKLLVRFYSKVEKTGTCWIWKAAKTKAGYGQFRINGKNIYAHRVSFEISKSLIPEGLDLDHLCRNPSCVNPEHLEAVTKRENQKRGNINQFKNRTHCKNGHEFTKDNIASWELEKNGFRRCIQCKITSRKIYYKKNKSKLLIKQKIRRAKKRESNGNKFNS